MWPPPYHAIGESVYTPPTGVPLQIWGHLQPGRKAATYLQEPPSSCNLRNSRDSVTAPTVKPDLGFSSWYEGCCSVEPIQGCQKCDRSTFSGVAQVH